MSIQPIDIFSIICLITTVVLFYFILRPTEISFDVRYGLATLIEVLYRLILLIPLMGIWMIYFFVRWIFKV